MTVKEKNMSAVRLKKKLIQLIFIKVMKSSVYIFLILIYLSGCSKKVETKDENTETEINKLVEEEFYSDFYKNFFNDRTFQMSRINFPLRGSSTEFVFDEESHPDIENDKFKVSNGKFYWKRNGWVFLNEMDISNQEYSVEFIEKANRIDQIIKSKIDDFVILLEFERIYGKWYLIYYSSEWY